MRFKETDRDAAKFFLSKSPAKCPGSCLYLNAQSHYGGVYILHTRRVCAKYEKGLKSRIERRGNSKEKDFIEWRHEYVFRCEECLESGEIEV